jgi:hypothetical protein
MPGDRATGGVLSFGDFSLHKQRKVTRSPQASGSSALSKVARSPEASGSFALRKEQEQSKMDSRFRGNDGKG